MLIFWLHAATGSAHYFFFRRAAKSELSILPSLSASSLPCLPFNGFFFALQSLQVPHVQALPLAFDFGPLPKPGSPFFLPHPHAAHILLTRFRWFRDLLFSRACGNAVRNLFATLHFHAYLYVAIPTRVSIFSHYAGPIVVIVPEEPLYFKAPAST